VTTGEGPCQSAYEQRTTIAVLDQSNDARWPDYRAGALKLGLSSVVAVPVQIGDMTMGALNFYSREVGFGGSDTIWAAELLAAAVAAVMHETDLKLELESLSGQLRSALESRATIDQAKGIVMARQHCTPEEAFELLVKISSRTNVKLREVARRVVAEAAHQ
jgi:transcriptional regulator with GAF, ATPase, and Fis domain